MTAPSAPGVALYEGCFGVTRGPDEKGGEVVGPLYEVQPSRAYAWSVEGRSRGQWAEDGEDGYAPAGAKESSYDLISVHPTREKAEAWLRAYRDAQDRATAVPARSTTAEWSPEGEGGSIIVGRGRDTPTPQPAAAPTPAPDWEARRWELAVSASAADIERFREPFQNPMGGSGIKHRFTPEQARVRYADALIAAMQEKQP